MIERDKRLWDITPRREVFQSSELYAVSDLLVNLTQADARSATLQSVMEILADALVDKGAMHYFEGEENFLKFN